MSYQFKGVKQVLKGTYDKLSTAEKKGHIYFVRETSSSTGGDIYFGSRHYGHYNATELSDLEKSIKNLLGTGVTTSKTVTTQLNALTAKFKDYLPLSGGKIKRYGELTFDKYSQLVIPSTAEFYYQGYNLRTLFAEKSNRTHKHDATDVTGGTFDIARIPTGTTSTTVALGAHTHTIANVTNLQTSLDSKINVGSESDAAGVKSYYGLKKDIAAAVTSVYKVQGSKDNYSDLPTTGNTKGDVWNVVNANGNTPAGTNYVWDGTKWDALGGTIDLSGYSKTDHKHTAADVTGGTFNIARIPTGTSSTTVALGNHNHDTVYSKTGHTHAISEVTDLQTTLSGKAPNSHAVTATTYGVGTASNYGHNKIVSGDVSTITAVTNGNSAASFHNHDGAYAKSTHKHVAGDITGGTFDIARIPSITIAKLPTGTTSTTVALGNHTHSNYLTDKFHNYELDLGSTDRPIYLKNGTLLPCTPYSTFTNFEHSSNDEKWAFSSFYGVSNSESETNKITNAGGKYIGNGLRTINYNPLFYFDHNSQLGFSFDYPLLLWRKTIQSGGAWSWDNWKVAQAMPFCTYDTTTNATGFGGKQFSNYANSGEIRFPFMYMEGTTHFSKSLGYWANTMLMNEFNESDSGVNPYTSMFGISSNLATPKAFIGAGKNTEQGKWNLLQLVTENYTGDVTITGAFTQSKGNFTVDGNATMNGLVTMTRSSEIYGNLTVKGQINSAKGFFETSDERLKTFGDNIDVDFEKISKLKKAYFVFNDDKDKKQHIGVSAQEVKGIYPELVSEGENGYLTVDYAKLSVVALSAVDKLNNELTEIKSMLKELLNKK